MANTWLNCVIRKDLKLPEGLLAAQAAHISDQWMRDRILSGEPFTSEEKEWMQTPYINILAVDTKEEIDTLIKDANNAGFHVTIWKDILPSSNLRKNIPEVLVGFSIGPADMDKLKEVTGNLPRF